MLIEGNPALFSPLLSTLSPLRNRFTAAPAMLNAHAPAVADTSMFTPLSAMLIGLPAVPAFTVTALAVVVPMSVISASGMMSLFN